MFTLTSQYALRAMFELSRVAGDQRLTSQEIAARADIPPKYLLVILNSLARAGLLDSLRGAAGGYRLKRDAGSISLSSIVQRFEPAASEAKRCPFGNRECGTGNPCPVHDEYRELMNHRRAFLQARSLADVKAHKTTD